MPTSAASSTGGSAATLPAIAAMAIDAGSSRAGIHRLMGEPRGAQGAKMAPGEAGVGWRLKSTSGLFRPRLPDLSAESIAHGIGLRDHGKGRVREKGAHEMNLHRLLLKRAQSGNPVRVGLIGAGKFGSMFLAQAHRTPGLHLAAVVDLAPARAREAMAQVGWPAERISAPSLDRAMASGSTYVDDDAEAMIASPRIEVVIDATGVPAAGIRHALLAIEHGKHIVMVNVEADVLAGPLLAERAARAGVVY